MQRPRCYITPRSREGKEKSSSKSFYEEPANIAVCKVSKNGKVMRQGSDIPILRLAIGL